MKIILGVSAYYHDSAAALLVEGDITAAAQEERFTRKKHDSAFPTQAIQYCLREAGISLKDVSAIVFYDKPFLKFERLLETYLTYAPRGFLSFLRAMPIWMKEKMFMRGVIRRELCKKFGQKKRDLPPILFSEHHLSHAASAFFPSPFHRAAVLCLDGVGEWATTTAWKGNGKDLQLLWEIDFPHSLGLLYSAFTYYTGFKVNSGEYKLMGLAPYGEPKYVQTILDNLVDLKNDGTFHLNMKYFSFTSGLTMTNDAFHNLFGSPPRKPETQISQREMDLARSIQSVTEEIVLRLARSLHAETGEDYLCLAGGVALNCVANGRLLREGPFKDIWIQPAAGDAGGALGAALTFWHQYLHKDRTPTTEDQMKGSYLGPSIYDAATRKYLQSKDAPYEHFTDEKDLFDRVATLLEEGKVIGWVQGRMEFGPRALGSRSILGDPRNVQMQSNMNLRIKFRESFRPFAPAVLAESAPDFFELDRSSPYMLLVAPVKNSLRMEMSPDQEALFGIEKLKVPRSAIPAVTHVDYTARVQTVHVQTNPRFHALLTSFRKRTGCSVLVNTSFNVRGEPIVTDEKDAYRCFMRTNMDYLVVGNCLIDKGLQPAVEESEDWKQEFALD